MTVHTHSLGTSGVQPGNISDPLLLLRAINLPHDSFPAGIPAFLLRAGFLAVYMLTISTRSPSLLMILSSQTLPSFRSLPLTVCATSPTNVTRH